jgi:hypothetical protein
MAVKKGSGSGEKTGEANKTVTDKKASSPKAVTARVNPTDNAFARKATPAAEPTTPEFQSDLALDIMEELYPLLLENCTDEDDEIDTQAVFEVLAGLIGLFTAEYHENYGAEKASAAFQDLVSLALATYQQRLVDSGE